MMPSYRFCPTIVPPDQRTRKRPAVLRLRSGRGWEPPLRLFNEVCLRPLSRHVIVSPSNGLPVCLFQQYAPDAERPPPHPQRKVDSGDGVWYSRATIVATLDSRLVREETMPRVGVRDLKNRASEILRSVREDGAEYVITYQGRPTAVL